MKGIILAGGSGTRLYPLTKTTSKQLLPVYDKPMIYYPLSTLMLMGIKDILIISTPEDTPNIEKLLGDGSKLGMQLQYKVQDEPNGIAQAFLIGEDFIDNEEVCLILGDNIFYTGDQFKNPLHPNTSQNNAMIFAFQVPDPERFGVIEFDSNMTITSIEEKPKNPKSDYVSVGLYFYPNDVVAKAKSLRPSARGELEISDLNNLYLSENRITASLMGQGYAWLDAGTPESLMDAPHFVHVVEKRQGLKVGCIEEIAFRLGYIDANQMQSLINELKGGTYKAYLKNALKRGADYSLDVLDGTTHQTVHG